MEYASAVFTYMISIPNTFKMHFILLIFGKDLPMDWKYFVAVNASAISRDSSDQTTTASGSRRVCGFIHHYYVPFGHCESFQRSQPIDEKIPTFCLFFLTFALLEALTKTYDRTDSIQVHN